MAITSAQQTSIIKLAVGMFNAAPGGYMGTLQDVFVAGGSSLVNLANNLASTTAFTGLNSAYSTNGPDDVFARAWVNNLVGDTATVANKDAAVNFVTALLGGGQSRGAVMNQIITLLDGIAHTDSDWGNASLQFDNRVTVASFYTLTQSGSSTSLSTLQGIIASVGTTQPSVDAAKDAIIDSTGTFTLTTGATSVNEGATATFTLTTTNVPDGTVRPYTLTGVSTADVTGGLSGTATVTGGKATITVALANDQTTEGAETLKVSLDNGKTSATTTVNDTSLTTTYALAAGATSVNEGSTATFTLATTNVADGTVLAYTLTGVTASDVTGALTGNATVSGGTATISVALAADQTTDADTLKVSLDNGKASATTIVNDTSQNPVYTVTAGAASVNEGSSATFTITADQTIADGATIAYKLGGTSGAADYTDAGAGTATFSGGKATVTLALTADQTTDAAETVTVTAGTSTATTTIGDTSVTPVLATDSVSGTIVSGQGTAIISPASLIANDTSSTGAALTGTPTLVAGSAVNGEVLTSKDGNFVFLATSGARTGSFQYEVAGVTGKGTVNVTLNTAPAVTTVALAATEDTAATGTVTATDADSDTLTYSFSALNGTVTNTAGAYTYTPTANFNGADTITVKVADAFSTTSGTIAVTVAAVDDSPSVISPAPSTVSVVAGGTAIVDLTKYATDVDTDVSKLTFTPAATTTKGGTVSVAAGVATVTYAEGGGTAALGADTFAFTVSDGTSTASTTVNLTVSNTAPVATDFALAAKTGVTQTVDLSTRATDADINTLTPAVVVGSVSAGGSAEVSGGKLIYTSTIGYTGTETVQYTVSDGFGGTSNTGTITFTVASNTGGTSAADLLYGSKSAEAIDGLAGNDTINGGGGLDTITGGDGDDIVTFSDGASQILGAGGVDTLVINSDAVASAWDLANTSNQNRDTSSKNSLNVTTIVRTFENIDATKSSNAIVLTNTGIVTGGATITNLGAQVGGDVASTISVLTGSGDDRLNFDSATGGTVTVTTNDGNDQIFVQATATGKFSISGGAGNDSIRVNDNAAVNTIMGGDGNDTIVNVSAATGDSIDGGAGNDNITGGAAAETLLGGVGDDTISSGGGNDTIDGGAGNDQLTASTATGDTLSGGDGDDTLIAADVADSLVGGAGNDTFAMTIYLAATSTITGGDGTDTVSMTGLTGALTLATYTKVTGIESWNVTPTTNQNSSVTAADYAGLTNITYNEDATTTAKTFGVTGLTTGATVTLVSNTDANTIGVVTIAKTDATATTDALTVNLRGFAAATGTSIVDSLTTTGYETLTIDSGVATGTTAQTAAKANVVTTIDDVDLKTLTLTGASVLTISGMTAGAAPTTVNAGAMTGAFNYTTAVTSNVALTGGSGNDTFALGTTLNNSDTVDGGAGTADSLTATVSGATATTGALRISNVETINLTEATTSTIDVTNISGATSVNFAGNSTALTITNLPASGLAVGLGFAGSATAHTAGTVTASLKDATGTADSLTFNLQGTAAQAATLVTTGIENVTLAVNKEINGNQTLNVLGLTATNLSITGGTNGNDDSVILGTLNVATTTLDATGFTGITTATASATATSVKVAGGVVDIIDGGAGNDTFTVTSVGTTALDLDGAGGTDALILSKVTGALNFTNVVNFETISLAIAAGVTATPSNYAGFNDSDVKTITVTGGGTLSGVASALVFVGTSLNTALTSFDASGYASTVTLSYTVDLLDSSVTVKGGSGASDSLTGSYADAQSTAPVASGFETVTAVVNSDADDAAEAYTINTAGITGATIVLRTGAVATIGNNQATTLTNLAAGVAVQVGDATANYQNNSTITATLASATGTADALSVTLRDTEAAATISLVSAGVETLNLAVSSADGVHTVSLAGVAATAGSTNTVNVTGGKAADLLTLTTFDTTTTVVNASTFIGNLTIIDRGSSAMTITGGTATDNIRMESGSDVLDGASGTDTLTVQFAGIAGAVIDLSSSTDQITLFNGTANSAVQKGFENVNASGYTGGAVDVTAATGGSVMRGTALADVIRMGAGADSAFILTPASNGVDTITGFAVAADKIALLEGGSTWNAAGSAGAAAGTAVDTTDYYDTSADETVLTANAIYELTASRTTTELSTGGDDAVAAYVFALNSTTGVAELWYDSEWDTAANRVQVATFSDITTIGGVTAFTFANFLEYI